MSEPLTPWGEAELRIETIHAITDRIGTAASELLATIAEVTEAIEAGAQMRALADEMLAAAEVLEKVSTVYYRDANPSRMSWSADDLRTESAHVRAEGAHA